MNDTYYATKHMSELIRIAETNLKQLKTTNKQIEDLLDLLEREQSDKKNAQL